MDKSIKRLILLISLVLVVIPMFIFPSRLGMPLVKASAVYMLYELVFYGVVLFFFRQNTSLVPILVGAALTLVYRMTIGAAFGLIIVIMYGMDTGIALSLGMGRYLPAVLLQMAAAPFVMRPVYLGLATRLMANEVVHPIKTDFEMRSEDIAVKENIQVTINSDRRPHTIDPVPTSVRPEPLATVGGVGGNPFDRAMAYVGEAVTVKLAMLVDGEGLPLAQYNRGHEDAEMWAPVGNILEGELCKVLDRFVGNEFPDRIDIGTRSRRILLRRIDNLTLLVITDSNVDETIHIRMTKAVDMIRKFINDRYSPHMFVRLEEHYVSDS